MRNFISMYVTEKIFFVIIRAVQNNFLVSAIFFAYFQIIS